MENNKLMAEFMDTKGSVDFHDGKGYGPIYWYKGIHGGKTPYKENELEYHKSWDWLIPVVEKIESLDLKEYGYQWEGIDGETEYNNGSIHVEIERNKCWIYMDLSLDPSHTLNEKTSHIEFPTKLEATYAAVVEFIEYYNILTKQD